MFQGRLSRLTGLLAVIMLCVTGIHPLHAQEGEGGADAKARFYAVQEHLDVGGDAYLYANVSNLITQFMNELRQVMIERDADADVHQALSTADQVIKALGLYGLGEIGMSAVDEGDHVRQKAFLGIPGGRQGVFGLLGADPRELATLEAAPADTMIFAATDFDFQGALQLTRDVVDRIASPGASADVDNAIADAGLQAGIDLHKVITSLAGHVAFMARTDPEFEMLLPLPEGPPVPVEELQFMFIIDTRDDTLYEELKRVTLAQAVATTETVDGAVTRLGLISPPNKFWGVQPAIARDEGHFYVTSHVTLLEKSLAAMRGEVPSLNDTDEFRELAEGFDIQGNAVSFVSERIEPIVARIAAEVEVRGREHMQPEQLATIKSALAAVRQTLAVRINQPDGIAMQARTRTGASIFSEGPLNVVLQGLATAIIDEMGY